MVRSAYFGGAGTGAGVFLFLPYHSGGRRVDGAYAGNGDKLVVWGAGYEPQRGDVVIVDSYTSYGRPLVKRVIAKGGDTISIDYATGTVEVNGKVLEGDYIAEPTYLGYDVEFPYTVPEGTVFVMGDNRNASLDSRSSYVGCIDEQDILGKVLLCFLPFSDFGVVK